LEYSRKSSLCAGEEEMLTSGSNKEKDGVGTTLANTFWPQIVAEVWSEPTQQTTKKGREEEADDGGGGGGGIGVELSRQMVSSKKKLQTLLMRDEKSPNGLANSLLPTLLQQGCNSMHFPPE
jgi:hypothetical protein